MTATEDDSAFSRSRASAHKFIMVGIWAGLCGAIVAGFLVAVGTSVPLYSAAVVEFVLRWAVATGFGGALLATVYWEVRA